MSDISLLPPAALTTVDLGLSVSESADVDRLGMTDRHVELAIAEIARAVLVYGGRITYGGWIKPLSFTDLLMNEVNRYGTGADSVRFCLAFPEHQRMPLSELVAFDNDLEAVGRLICLDPNGDEMDPHNGRGEEGQDTADSPLSISAYSGLRRYMAERTTARVILGGRLTGFRGLMPGVIEEAITSVDAGQPLYVAAGFGGAAAALVKALDVGSMRWLPEGMPEHWDDNAVQQAADVLRRAAIRANWDPLNNGLTPSENRQLIASYRATEIAGLVSLGLARTFGPR